MINEKKLYDLLYKSFVCKDNERASGVFHKNGHLYASNGHIISRIMKKRGKLFANLLILIEKGDIYI
jgi:hypothetical protein